MKTISFSFFLISCILFNKLLKAQVAKTETAPRIINIVNFVRLLEPRDSAITEEVLYQTVVKQAKILKRYHLKGTFLLQYDALMDSRYQKLLKSLPKKEFEIGAWWEIPQPLIENAGMKWRGKYPWDWRANIGFSTGYTQSQRKKLVDTYMHDFKKIFGYYPKSVASWFIDAFSLNYMYEKYHVVASANCKDQYGTDGYTLWGGYWNQAYYPSKTNAYMPAQHADDQIPVPIFRMLGSDPLRQYDNGLGNSRQGVVTLEPVYRFGGGDSVWVHWFFNQMIDGERLAFAYTQAGQENSFTWKAMEKGYEIQMPLIARLRNEHKLDVETLAESGKWFRSHFKVTPPTAVTVSHDIGQSDAKTVWYDSRFYRTNFIWEREALRIRDVHLFNEKFPSHYFNNVTSSNECRYFTLPFTDGYLWSRNDTLAGIRFKADISGKEILLKGDSVAVTKNAAGDLQIAWRLSSVPGMFWITCSEQRMAIQFAGSSKLHWHLDLTTADNIELPFTAIRATRIDCRFENFTYDVTADVGKFTEPCDATFSIEPANNKIVLGFDE